MLATPPESTAPLLKDERPATTFSGSPTRGPPGTTLRYGRRWRRDLRRARWQGWSPTCFSHRVSALRCPLAPVLLGAPYERGGGGHSDDRERLLSALSRSPVPVEGAHI